MKNRVAFVTESLFSMGGANRVLEKFLDIYPQADIYALFGNKKDISSKINKAKICFSFLNKIPFIKKSYRYTYSLWPFAIEQFDFSNYDLLISLSSSVAHGVITPVYCKHICYLHSPMRYAWDMKDVYTRRVGEKFGIFKFIFSIILNKMRVWDTSACNRPDTIIANSVFTKDRAQKYWGREIGHVVYPPVDNYTGEIFTERGKYFVSGAPFEPNKGGDFLLECASKLGFNLKIIGIGSMEKKLKRKYRKYKNIQFLGKISDEEKWKLLSKASGYVQCGVEDFGIFPIEAMLCGTPVLAYRGGGILESLVKGSTGLFFDVMEVDEFEKVFKRFGKEKWDYEKISKYAKKFCKKDFKEKILRIVNN